MRITKTTGAISTTTAPLTPIIIKGVASTSSVLCTCADGDSVMQGQVECRVELKCAGKG